MSLNSLTIPCLPQDLNGFERLLSIWSESRLFPIHAFDEAPPIPLVVVLNRLDESTEKKFLAAFEKRQRLHSVFSNCVVKSAELQGDRDLYARNQDRAVGRWGNKAGPNFLFFETMRLLHPYGGFTFQNEIDCYPLRPGWLSELRTLLSQR